MTRQIITERKKIMTFNIQLKEINDVYKLVNILVGFDGDVDLESGRYKVDGKSILGIFSLDLLSPITVIAHTEYADDFFAKLERFKA